MTDQTIEQLNAQERQRALRESYERHRLMVLRQKFRPRKRRIAGGGLRMARREKFE